MSLPEADFDLTQSAMQSGNPNRFGGDDRLRVRFYLHPKLNSARSEAEGRPIYEEIPYVEIMTPGNKDNIIQRPATDLDKQRFAERYRQFQAREDQERVEGTLLSEWPGITRGQVEELKFFQIQTVEQLAVLSDSNSQNIMGVQMLKQKAREYLENAKESATSQALADAQAQIAALTARLDASEVPQTAIETQAPQAAVETHTAAVETPAKRGRPRKTED